MRLTYSLLFEMLRLRADDGAMDLEPLGVADDEKVGVLVADEEGLQGAVIATRRGHAVGDGCRNVHFLIRCLHCER